MAPIEDSFAVTGMTKGEQSEASRERNFNGEVGQVVIDKIDAEVVTGGFLERAKQVYPKLEWISKLVWSGDRAHRDDGDQITRGKVVEITQPDSTREGAEKIALPVFEEPKSGNQFVISPDGSVHQYRDSMGMGPVWSNIENASIKVEGVDRWLLDPRLEKEGDWFDINRMGGDPAKGSYNLEGDRQVTLKLVTCDRNNLNEMIELGPTMSDTLTSRGKLVTGQKVG